MKCQIFKHRFTIFNEFGQIILAVAVATTSYNDAGVKLAFEALCAVWQSDARPKPIQVALDAPWRDGPGALRNIPMLKMSVDGEPYQFEGNVKLLHVSSGDVDRG